MRRVRQIIRAEMSPAVRQLAGSEDVVQSAALEVLERRRQGTFEDRGAAKLFGWLLRASRSKIRNLGQAAARARRTSVSHDAVAGLASSGPSPSSHVRRGEERSIMRQCLGRLGSVDQAAILNAFVLELKGQELGESLGLSPSAAAHRRERALEHLAELLAHEL